MDEQCIEHERALDDDDLLWGEPVGEEVATLLGPYEGTWTWEDGDGVVEVPDAGTSFPATASIEIDPTSYRFVEVEFIEGNRIELFPDRLIPCGGIELGFHADGVLTVVDQHGTTVVTAPLAIRRDRERWSYWAEPSFEPISSFSEGLRPLHEFDNQSVDAEISWRTDDGPFYIDVDFTGQQTLPDTPGGHSAGAIAWGDVATFEVP